MAAPEKVQSKAWCLPCFPRTSPRRMGAEVMPSSLRTSSSPDTTEVVRGEEHSERKDTANSSEEPLSNLAQNPQHVLEDETVPTETPSSHAGLESSMGDILQDDGLVADGGCFSTASGSVVKEDPPEATQKQVTSSKSPSSQNSSKPGPEFLMKKVNDTQSRLEGAKHPDEVFRYLEELKEIMVELKTLKEGYDQYEVEKSKKPTTGKPAPLIMSTRFQHSVALCGDVLMKLGDGFLKTSESVVKLVRSQEKTAQLVSKGFREVGQVHWAGLVLSGIAFVLDNWRLRAANKEQFKKTFNIMFLLGEYVLVVTENVQTHPTTLSDRSKRMTASIVQRAVEEIFTCIKESISEMKKDGNPLSRFLFAKITAELLESHEKRLATMFPFLDSTVALDSRDLLVKLYGMVQSIISEFTVNKSLVSAEDGGASGEDNTLGGVELTQPESKWKSNSVSGVKKFNDNLYEFVLDSNERREPKSANLVLIFFHDLQLDDSMKREEIHWKTWTFSDQPQTCWPAKMFLEDHDLVDEDVVVRSFAAKYDANIRKTEKEGRSDLYAVANNCTQLVINQVMKKLDKSQPIPPIVLVAHGYGGIVIQEMIKHAYNAARNKSDEHQIQFLKSLRGVFFYSTPHGGLKQDVFDIIVSVGSSTTSSNSSGALVKRLQQHDKHLSRSVENFIKNLNAIPEHQVIGSGVKIKTMSVVEKWNTRLEDWTGTITEEAAAGVGDVPHHIDADHFSITKPSSGDFADNKYVFVREFILTIVEDERKRTSRGDTASSVDYL
ncbi:hypothetical protein R1sor_015137 [Riccia sorocarpa]|uniref:Uncharacterized protein n=1 Tax=Riccia sorocarpa TaxID=122646 RepID=A0ABD3HBR0_9MARC